MSGSIVALHRMRGNFRHRRNNGQESGRGVGRMESETMIYAFYTFCTLYAVAGAVAVFWVIWKETKE